MATDPRLELRVKYQTVAASQTDAALGATGAIGDILEEIIIVPATVGAGSVSIKDGTTSISLYATGTLTDLKPIVLPLGIRSTASAWKVTTGGNVSVIAIGQFS